MKISGQIVDLHRREIYGGDVETGGGKIISVMRNPDAPAHYILPGLIDSHVHIESSMVTPSQFAAAAVRHGTVAVVSDPHEIANVLGMSGVEYMIEDAALSPLCFLFGAPSCVPATPFETSGAILTAADTAKLLRNPDIGYLAEMMNYPGVIYGDAEVMAKIDAAKKASKPVDGHAPGLTGKDLEKYVHAGISTDHECSSVDEAIEKIKLGMKILIREGSAARNLDALKSLIDKFPDQVMLCSDDLHPEMLEKGHINLLVAKLIREGYDVFNVLRAVTVNPKEHYNLKSGLLRAGDNADFIITDDLRVMKIKQTWIRGKTVFETGKEQAIVTGGKPVNRFNASALSSDSVKVRNEGGSFRVIHAFNGELLTESISSDAGQGDFVECDTRSDIIKIVVKDRYTDSPPVTGFIHGFGLKTGAFATSVAHDSHNIIAAGTNDEMIIEAINAVISSKGGMAVADANGTAILPLPVAGIMSDSPVSVVAERYEKLSARVKDMGCRMDAPFMTLSFMALLVIPKLKICDKGLFDVTSFSPVELFIH